MFIILIILWLWLETPEPRSTTLLSFEADRIANELLKMIVVALGAGVGAMILIPLCCCIIGFTCCEILITEDRCLRKLLQS